MYCYRVTTLRSVQCTGDEPDNAQFRPFYILGACNTSTLLKSASVPTHRYRRAFCFSLLSGFCTPALCLHLCPAAFSRALSPSRV